MSSTRLNSRHVRQRKLNTKQPLRIIREHEIEDAQDHESQHIPAVETGVEKNEEVEFHLQAVINAAAAKQKQSFIPTPDVQKAKDIKYDDLYPKVFREPATYIRFSSTVEDCIGTSYCMNESDAEFLSQLNDGKDVDGQPVNDKSAQCSDDSFEEVMSFFEETSVRLQPFANLDNTPVLSLQEMEAAQEDPLSLDAQRFVKYIYQYWATKKGGRPMMPSIKVRVLDTTSDADDADPYICFRRREVRQTRKTRGRDAQVVEKLKKLRLELEDARNLVRLIYQREELNKQNLEISRKVFEQRGELKRVKIQQKIVGDKGDDEDLLVNQRPQPKPKARDGTQRGPTIRIPTRIDRSAPENDLVSLEDMRAESESQVQHTIDSRKEQHRRWNQGWNDLTKYPLTPPAENADQQPKWAPLFSDLAGYPTPPPSLPSRNSQDRDGDVEMAEQRADAEDDTVGGAESQFTFFCPPSLPTIASDDESCDDQPRVKRARLGNPSCRLRYGRGGRCHLEIRKQPKGAVFRGVVSDSESDDEMEVYHPVSPRVSFEHRVAYAMNNRLQQQQQQQQRPESVAGHKQWSSGDQTAMMAQGQSAAAGSSQSPPLLRQQSSVGQ